MALSHLTPTLLALLAEAEKGLPTPVTRAQIVPGAEVAWDDVCGQLSIRVQNVAPVYSQRTAAGGRCSVMRWDVTIGIGVIRCVATVDDRGNPPKPATLTAEAGVMMDDMVALRTVLDCFTFANVLRVEPTQWTSQGPQGQAAGGEWQAVVALAG